MHFLLKFYKRLVLKPYNLRGAGVQLLHFLPLPGVRDGHVEGEDSDLEVIGTRSQTQGRRRQSRAEHLAITRCSRDPTLFP